MSAVTESRVGEYRGRAALLRRLAFQTKNVETKARLLALADSFEKLASRVDAREGLAASAAG